jgi:hypothetical protein
MVRVDWCDLSYPLFHNPNVGVLAGLFTGIN